MNSLRIEIVYEVDEFTQFLEIVKDKSFWIKEIHAEAFGSKAGELDFIVQGEGGGEEASSVHSVTIKVPADREDMVNEISSLCKKLRMMQIEHK